MGPETDRIWHPGAGVTAVIRTDFAHPDEWERIREAIVEPQTEAEFVAYVRFVDDPVHQGMTPSELLAAAPEEVGATFAFLVDEVTLTHPDRPILVVCLYDYTEAPAVQGRGPTYGATFRVIPAEMWSVQNNLSLSNLDWEDFADNVDEDGVFRGLR